MTDTIGWDVGGVNTKVARVGSGAVLEALTRPYELQRAPEALVPVLSGLAREIGATPQAVHGVTMTAELSQMFRTKREGVAFVLDAVEAAFPLSTIKVFANDGRFLDPGEARREVLAVAASNWAASAQSVAQHYQRALLIDVGTTTTDIIPIVDGKVAAQGRTDPERLASGELVYTGAVRTPAEAMASHLRLETGLVGVSAEGFALAGDVHVWRGTLDPTDYTVPTPDGRPATRQFAGERLARVICADREMLDEVGISAIADTLARAQIERMVSSIRRVLSCHASLDTAIVTGLGAFLGGEAARSAGLNVIRLADEMGDAAAVCAPAACVALLLESAMADAASRPRRPGARHSGTRHVEDASPHKRDVAQRKDRSAAVDIVVKVGGGLLAHQELFSHVLATITDAAGGQRLVVVAGGGPFADAVREVDRALQLSDDAAHWMAVLAMDQYAHVIAEKLTGGVLVTDQESMTTALAVGRVPVLAVTQWLRTADPLPHTWDVTSDSIAAWVAGQLGARRLLLIKPPGAAGPDVVDKYFDRALPADVESVIVAADRFDVVFLRTSSEELKESRRA